MIRIITVGKINGSEYQGKKLIRRAGQKTWSALHEWINARINFLFQLQRSKCQCKAVLKLEHSKTKWIRTEITILFSSNWDVFYVKILFYIHLEKCKQMSWWSHRTSRSTLYTCTPYITRFNVTLDTLYITKWCLASHSTLYTSRCIKCRVGR